jgi:hypothetical protein
VKLPDEINLALVIVGLLVVALAVVGLALTIVAPAGGTRWG